MKNIRLILSTVLCLGMSSWTMAQTVKSHQVEGGGTGPYKSVIVADETLSTHTVYRPQDLKAAVKEQGKLPVILYANGACANNNVQMRLLLSEVASYGYIAIAIGPYDENDCVENWKEVLTTSYPEEKPEVILATGEKFNKPSDEVVEAMKAKRAAEFAALQNPQVGKKGKKNQAAPAPAMVRPSNKMMLDAMDWITNQAANPKSEYYQMVNLDKVAAMGQSCGGAMTLGVSHDPRIKTCVMLNSGIGQMEMNGVSKVSLATLHTPMFYLIGGKTDIAYLNAKDDFEAINQVPVVMYNTLDGHNGTYYEKSGGAYAVAVRHWLDWQLKGDQGKSAVFLNDDYAKFKFPTWTFERKGF